MTVATVVQTRHELAPRILTVRLAGSMSHTISMAAWAQRNCPSVLVRQTRELLPSPGSFDGCDYLFLMASSADGAEARTWLDGARSAGVVKVMVSLIKIDDGDLDPFGSGWDAFFVSRGTSLQTPLLLFLSDRLVGYDNADVWSMLGNRVAVLHSIGRNGSLSDWMSDDIVGLIAHFTMAEPSEEEPLALTLGEIDELYTALRSRLSRTSDSLLSVGTSCRAASDLIVFRIVDWGTYFNRIGRRQS